MDYFGPLSRDGSELKKPRTVGYTRIGPTDKADSQMKFTADLMFLDKTGSKTTEHRPQLEACMRSLRPDDLLLVPSMDRLARNTRELIELVEHITDIGANIHFLKENIDLGHGFLNFEEKFGLIKGVYDAEKALALERRKEGLVKAKKKGVRLGRPTKITNEKRRQIRQRLADGEKAPALAWEYGVSESLVYQIGRAEQAEEQVPAPMGSED